MSPARFLEWLRKQAEKIMGRQPVAASDGPVFLVDREGVCYRPERRVVLRAREG